MYYFYLLIMVNIVLTKSTQDFFVVNHNEPESDIVEILMSKGYLPNEKELPQPSLINNHQNNGAILLSKLSNDKLIKLLSAESNKNEFSLTDLINADENGNKPKTLKKVYHGQNKEEVNNLQQINKKNNAIFRLEDREVQSQDNNKDYIAWKKINNLLSVLPQQVINNNDKSVEERKKELLFDMYVAQLKSLCCKNKITQPELLSNNDKKVTSSFANFPSKIPKQKSGEFMFLIINDEIKSKTSDELILVDPDSIEKNSSVLLLGPITTPLTDDQLKTVMNRVSVELSKPEYVTLLQQLSNGTLNDNNKNLMDKFVFGPETRRYIKAHRCNHQSKLAKVYGAPKWLICTGYLNLNQPSLYD